jgi:hypothetical protein
MSGEAGFTTSPCLGYLGVDVTGRWPVMASDQIVHPDDG